MKHLVALLMACVPMAASAQGYPKFSAALSGTPVALKTSGGSMPWVYCGALAGPAFLQIWDVSAAPTPGSTAPVASLQWATNQPLQPDLGDGLRFSRGLYVAVTTTANGATGAGPVPCSFGVK